MFLLVLTAVGCGVFLFLIPVFAPALLVALVMLAALTVQAVRFARQSRTDDLTCLGNLRQLKAMERSYRRCRNIGVWYFDVDHLKKVNDSQGHSAGDSLLIGFASRLHGCRAPGARAYRVGGDEFLLILPNPSGGVTPPLPDASSLPASWGYAAGHGRDLRQLIEQAERQMYEGRRRQNEM